MGNFQFSLLILLLANIAADLCPDKTRKGSISMVAVIAIITTIFYLFKAIIF